MWLRIAMLSVSSVFLLFGASSAALYMTYTSEVIHESNTSGYDYGIHVGDILTHVYLIDKSQFGTYRVNGVLTVMPDKYYGGGQIAEDTYYSELISGALISNPLKRPMNLSIIDDKYSTDFYTEQGGYIRTLSWAGADLGSHLINAFDPADPAQNRGMLVYHYWAVEEPPVVSGSDLFLLQTINFQISQTMPTPVPVPPTMWLLGGSFVSLGILRKKFNK